MSLLWCFRLTALSALRQDALRYTASAGEPNNLGSLGERLFLGETWWQTGGKRSI
jgi:hypothetical protein